MREKRRTLQVICDGNLPSVTAMRSSPRCGAWAAKDEEVRTTLLTDASAEAFNKASVVETTLFMILPASVSKDTSEACILLDTGSQRPWLPSWKTPVFAHHDTYYMDEADHATQDPGQYLFVI